MTGPSAPMPSTPATAVVPGTPASNSSLAATAARATPATGDGGGTASRAPTPALGAHADPGAAANGPPGSATGPPARFASVLESQVARTAPAEGQKDTADSPNPRRSTPTTQASDAGTDISTNAAPSAAAPSATADLAGVIANLFTVVRQVLTPT